MLIHRQILTYYQLVSGMPHSEVSRESCSDSAQGDPLMSFIPLPKTANLVWAKELSRLPWLVVVRKKT